MSALLERPRSLNPGGVIPELTFRGGKLVGKVAEAVIGIPSLDLSVDAVSELKLSLSDPRFELLGSGLFATGTAVDWLDLALELAVVETGGTGSPTLDLTARSRGAQALKRAKGALVVRNMSPTAFAEAQAKAVGLGFAGEASAIRPSIARAEPEPGAGEPESSWDVIQGLAAELGFVAFEAAGRLLFGRPSWLIRHAAAAGTDWTVRYAPTGELKGDAKLLEVIGIPTCRRSANAKDTTVDVSVVRAGGLKVRPGDKATLAGVPTFDGDYLVKSVNIDLDALTPVGLSLAVPYDPPPQPPEVEQAEPASSSSSTGGTATGSSRGAGGTVSGPPVWPTQGRVSNRFGAPRPGGRKHAGLDIAAPEGTRIVATQGGTVTFAGWGGGYGNLVKVDHGGGLETRYAHMVRITASRGARVERGELLGFVGNTGASRGNHLHFEVRRGGSALNPEGYLP